MASQLLSMDEALAKLLASAPAPDDQLDEVPLMQACGRVLAADVTSGINVPAVDNSSMDGYAVRTADAALFAAGLPISQRIPAGTVPSPLAPQTVARIFTGAELPAGADAIVMQEQAVADGDKVVLNATPAAGEWVRVTGSDIQADHCILRAGIRLRAQEVALAASVGRPTLAVRKLLRVATFFTGDELVMPGEPLPAGKIYNSNRFLLPGMLAPLPVTHSDFGIVADTLASTRATLREAAEHHDLIITTGGVSVGEEDHVRPAVQAEGHIDLWSLAIKPGKPLASGRVRRSDGSEAVFIGLPGNPVSSFVTFALFVRPLLLRMAGVEGVTPVRSPLRADFDWPKADRRREFLRVRRNGQGGLELFPNQLSSVLTSTVWADGVVDNPAGQTIKRGDLVQFISFSDLLA